MPDVTSKWLHITTHGIAMYQGQTFYPQFITCFIHRWWLQGSFVLWPSVLAIIWCYVLVCSLRKVYKLPNSHIGFYRGSFKLPSSFLLYLSSPHPCTSKHLGSSSDLKGLSKYDLTAARQQQHACRPWVMLPSWGNIERFPTLFRHLSILNICTAFEGFQVLNK